MDNLNDLNAYFTNPGFNLGFILLMIWGITWKALALWRAAKEDSKVWFVALMLFQTWGLLEIAYLFYFAKNKMTFPELFNMVKNLDKKTK